MADLQRIQALPVAVIDIGSNSVRLVVYESDERAALPVFNEKVLCGLGQDLDRTGLLPEEAVVHTVETLKRFVRLAEEMGAVSIEMLATAAVREAQNGAAFADLVHRACGREIQVLSGEEEARFAAYGLLSGTPDADGILGDLGGGSVELVDVRDRSPGTFTTLPLGPVRFSRKELDSPSKAVAAVDAALDAVDWLDEGRGRTFYAVGGAWRSVAKMHMNHTGYPLHIIHNYEISSGEAVEFCKFVSNLSAETLAKVPGISKRRIGTLAFAGMLMHRILQRVRPSNVVLSAYGLREGCLYGRLDEKRRAEDPLLAYCRRFAALRHTSAVDGDAMSAWLKPAFPDADAVEDRLRQAACLMADIARVEHPDYRAEHSLMRILRFPFVGLSHRDRAFMALAVSSRHSQVRGGNEAATTIRSLLSEEETMRARAIGLGMRLAYTLSGGIPTILEKFTLRRVDDTLLLEVKGAENEAFAGEVVERRLNALSKVMNLPASVRQIP